jgi:hypothetical protein
MARFLQTWYVYNGWQSMTLTCYFWRILVLEFVDITIKKSEGSISYDTDEYDANTHMSCEGSEIYSL